MLMKQTISGHLEDRTCNGHMRSCTNKKRHDSWINNLQDVQWYEVDRVGWVDVLEHRRQGSLGVEVLAQTHSFCRLGRKRKAHGSNGKSFEN
eukprot:9192440-Heterocapsa_arctica.AAC.1